MKMCLFFFLFGLAVIATSAKSYDFVNLTNNDGLSNSSINTIFQNSKGLMWFGTWDGLNVYNGREFKVFKPDPGSPHSISNNIIRDVLEENEYVQWVATDLGINRLDMQSKKFERFFIDGVNQTVFNEHSFLIAKNSSNQIFAAVYGQGIFFFQEKERTFIRLLVADAFQFKKIFFDIDDNLWIHTENRTLYKIVFKKGGSNLVEVQNTVQFQHTSDIVAVFYDNDSDNEIWMQTADHKLLSYQISEGILKQHTFFNTHFGTINAMLFQDSYQLWGTGNGLFSFNPDTKQIESVLNNIPVLSLYAGTQQIIWVGTDMQGLWMLSPPREKFHTFSADNVPGFGKSAVRTFFEDENGLLWVGTKGSGLYVFKHAEEEGQLATMQRFTTSEGLLNNAVYTITSGKRNEYWIGTDGDGINYYDVRTRKMNVLVVPDSIKKKVNLSSVYSIYTAKSGILWVGTSGYGMYKIEVNRHTVPYTIRSYKQFVYRNNQPTSLSNNIVYSIIRDDENHLWIGTRGGGLNRFNLQTEQFQTFRFSSDNPEFISSDDVLCLYKDRKGSLWAGTSMGLNKLLRFEDGKPVFARFTEKEGMPNNTIHGILEDKEHNLWLSTNRGIARLIQDKTEFRIISYFKKDGLQNNEFSDGAFYESPASGKLYFGGISGFNVFNPIEITQSSYMPTLLLDAFLIDNIEINLDDYLKKSANKEQLLLSYKNKSFSFRFVPLDYLSGSKCEIAYMLEGYQQDWIQLGTSNTIVFSNLPKGNYVLKVKCSNADKIWSDELFTLPVRMQPPWWDTGFAYALYALLLILMTLTVLRFIRYQMNVRNNIRLKELEKQKNEEIHQAKLRFFTNIAHEFSNSLTLIYGPCEQLLQTHSTDGITRKYINIIKSNSERMQTLIQQLIEFRKAETGHLRIKIEKVDVTELVKFVLDNFLEVLEQKKIKLTLTFSPEVIIWNTDRDSLEKIIFNLVSNAVKYTPEDENMQVNVAISEDQRLFHMRVTNTGVGIQEAHRQRIFDRFEVLERFEKQVMKGLETSSGIGLALCKNLVEVLQGSIELESDGLTFTTFIIRLPEQEVVESTATGGNKETSGVISPKSILEFKPHAVKNDNLLIPDRVKEGLIIIIDDDPEIRLLLRDFLSDKYEIAEAANGQEAIEIMKIRMPVLIVSDIIMPVMDGVEFIKIMKEQELTRHIPIILLSSKSTVESQIEGLEVGADAYLNKPFHPRHLEAMIESLLHRNKAVLEYSESPYSAVEQLEGKLIRKEDKNLMVKITSIIYNHMDNEALSLDFIAGEIALSKMQLYRKVKEIMGQTPTEYIRSIRLKHAEKLLKTTNKTVLEIMYLCGFNNKAYFYREFAKKYHDTPNIYRKKTSIEEG